MEHCKVHILCKCDGMFAVYVHIVSACYRKCMHANNTEVFDYLINKNLRIVHSQETHFCTQQQHFKATQT